MTTLKMAGVMLALACIVSIGFWTVDTSDELPEGYLVNGYVWSSNSSGVIHDGHGSVSILYQCDHCLLRNESCELHDGTSVIFCGFSDEQWCGKPKVFLSLDGSVPQEIKESIPDSNYYISGRNTEYEIIWIDWSIGLEEGETTSLLFDEAEVTFLGFDGNMESIFKVVYR